MLAADSPASVGFCLPARAARAPRPRTPWPELASYSPARAPLLGHLFRHKLRDRKSTRLNSSHVSISYAVFCLKKKKKNSARQHVHLVALAYQLAPPVRLSNLASYATH